MPSTRAALLMKIFGIAITRHIPCTVDRHFFECEGDKPEVLRICFLASCPASARRPATPLALSSARVWCARNRMGANYQYRSGSDFPVDLR